MRAEDIVGTILVALTLLTGLGLACYDIAHENGYEKGIWHSQLYYEATGEFPAEDWVKRHASDRFSYPEQIIETLKPFKGGK